MHVAWLQARYGTKSTDGVTPYRAAMGAAMGSDYQGALCSFGETVLAKLPRPRNKSQVRWMKGVWAGKLERDDRGTQGLAEQRQQSAASSLAKPVEEVERPEPHRRASQADVPDFEPSDVEAQPASASTLPPVVAAPAQASATQAKGG